VAGASGDVQHNDSAWVQRSHPSADACRLFCFPHAGGSASYFFPVSKAMAPTVEVMAIQYPGRQERRSEPCLGTIDELVAGVVPELEAWLDRPIALFGHSMGAVIAFEVARVLEQRHGMEPLGLFVSGRRAPSCHRDETVHLGGDRRLLRTVAALNGTQSQVLEDDEMLQMILPALRADYRAIETYRWNGGPPLACPIWVFVGDDDPATTEDEALAWSAHTTGECALNQFPGGHFYLNEQAGEVIAAITRRIVEAR
jgi:surfactin synthase thioesterase subunit